MFYHLSYNHLRLKLFNYFNMYKGFRDTVVYKGKLIHFYKRAQILVGDIWGAYKRPVEESHPFYFNDLHEVTMFADYRVPQILLHLGVLEYSPSLLNKIESKQEILFASEEETEIRAG